VTAAVEDLESISQETADNAGTVAAAAEEQASSLNGVTEEIAALNDQTDQLCATLNRFTTGTGEEFDDLDTVVETDNAMWDGEATPSPAATTPTGTATADGGTDLPVDDDRAEHGSTTDIGSDGT
jgi:methyl-accepting chemotaxis protein